MQSLKDVKCSFTIPNNDITEKCEHVVRGNKISVPMFLGSDGALTCPMCLIEAENKEMSEAYQKQADLNKMNEKRAVFYQQSIVSDVSLLDASLDNYVISCTEQQENHRKAVICLERFKQGEIFNLFFQGSTGAGKSHLAYSIGKALADTKEYTVLFVSMNDLIEKIKSTFSKTSTLTQYDIVQQLTNVDFLVLDDLGAELGNLSNETQASDFVSKIIFSVMDGRQGKSSIFTTNLSGERFKTFTNAQGKVIPAAYDARTFRRLFNNFRSIKFNVTPNYTFKELDF